MTGLDICPKCKGLHFKTAPCIVRKPTVGYAKVEHRVAPETVQVSNPAPTISLKRPVGRPKTITDMKAYKAERARKYRADKKAAKHTTPPKPSIQTTTEERNEE